MNEAAIIYAYLKIDDFVMLLTVALIPVFATWLVLSLIPYTWEEGEVRERAKKNRDDFNRALPKKTLLALALIVFIFPSPRDIKYIIGGSVLINGIESASEIEGIDKLPDNLVSAANVFLEKVIDNKEK